MMLHKCSLHSHRPVPVKRKQSRRRLSTFLIGGSTLHRSVVSLRIHTEDTSLDSSRTEKGRDTSAGRDTFAPFRGTRHFLVLVGQRYTHTNAPLLAIPILIPTGITREADEKDILFRRRFRFRFRVFFFFFFLDCDILRRKETRSRHRRFGHTAAATETRQRRLVIERAFHPNRSDPLGRASSAFGFGEGQKRE